MLTDKRATEDRAHIVLLIVPESVGHSAHTMYYFYIINMNTVATQVMIIGYIIISRNIRCTIYLLLICSNAVRRRASDTFVDNSQDGMVLLF